MAQTLRLSLATMHDSPDPSSQIDVPASFVALFIPPGRLKPTAPRSEISARYEFCEDMAQWLTQTALDQRHARHVGEAEILMRIHTGLQSPEAAVERAEARWIVTRLAELLNWAPPDGEPAAAST